MKVLNLLPTSKIEIRLIAQADLGELEVCCRQHAEYELSGSLQFGAFITGQAVIKLSGQINCEMV